MWLAEYVLTDCGTIRSTMSYPVLSNNLTGYLSKLHVTCYMVLCRFEMYPCELEIGGMIKLSILNI